MHSPVHRLRQGQLSQCAVNPVKTGDRKSNSVLYIKVFIHVRIIMSAAMITYTDSVCVDEL